MKSWMYLKYTHTTYVYIYIHAHTSIPWVTVSSHHVTWHHIASHGITPYIYVWWCLQKLRDKWADVKLWEGDDPASLPNINPMGDNVSKEGILKLPASLKGHRRVICDKLPDHIDPANSLEFEKVSSKSYGASQRMVVSVRAKNICRSTRFNQAVACLIRACAEIAMCMRWNVRCFHILKGFVMLPEPQMRPQISDWIEKGAPSGTTVFYGKSPFLKGSAQL